MYYDGGFSADFTSAFSIQPNWIPMSPKAVEQLLTQDARLLARRDAPALDTELEAQRQAALEVFYQWQDGVREYQDLMLFCVVIKRKVDLNRDLLRWEQAHLNN